MKREDIRQEVLEIMKSYSCAGTVLKESDSLELDLNLDSLDRTELLMDLEIKFNIEINNEEAKKAYTVGDIVDIIFASLKKG